MSFCRRLVLMYQDYKLLTKNFLSPIPSSDTDENVLHLFWKLEFHYLMKVLRISCIFLIRCRWLKYVVCYRDQNDQLLLLA